MTTTLNGDPESADIRQEDVVPEDIQGAVQTAADPTEVPKKTAPASTPRLGFPDRAAAFRDRLAKHPLNASPPAPLSPDVTDSIPIGLEDLADDPPPRRSQEDAEIDAVLGRLTISKAYEIFCGKMVPVIGSGDEVRISCPIPGHLDAHPSASMNVATGVWYCPVCVEGGDRYDLAAYGRGFAVPGYKTDGSFPNLRRAIANPDSSRVGG